MFRTECRVTREKSWNRRDEATLMLMNIDERVRKAKAGRERGRPLAESYGADLYSTTSATTVLVAGSTSQTRLLITM